jgi:hypothetical protein
MNDKLINLKTPDPRACDYQLANRERTDRPAPWPPQR